MMFENEINFKLIHKCVFKNKNLIQVIYIVFLIFIFILQ